MRIDRLLDLRFRKKQDNATAGCLDRRNRKLDGGGHARRTWLACGTRLLWLEATYGVAQAGAEREPRGRKKTCKRNSFAAEAFTRLPGQAVNGEV